MLRLVLKGGSAALLLSGLLLFTVTYLGRHTHTDIIAFTALHAHFSQEIYIIDAVRDLPLRLTYSGANQYATIPAFSPDGQQLVYVQAGLDGTHALMLADAYGGQSRVLHPPDDGLTYYYLNWSPDGRQIAALGSIGPSEYLFTVDPVTGDERVLFYRSSALIGDAVYWSPDSQRLLFNVEGEGAENYNHLYTIRPDGSDLRQLSRDDALDFDPVWSPDGEQIAFTSYRDGPRDVFLMSTRGRSARNLTQGVGDADMLPQWSPDGRSLAFVSSQPGLEGAVGVLDVTTDALRELPYSTQIPPQWSPDGAHLLLYARADNSTTPGSTGKGWLRVLHVADGTTRSLAQRLVMGAAWPAWRP